VALVALLLLLQHGALEAVSMGMMATGGGRKWEVILACSAVEDGDCRQ
jgi:hypothetical protein